MFAIKVVVTNFSVTARRPGDETAHTRATAHEVNAHGAGCYGHVTGVATAQITLLLLC